MSIVKNVFRCSPLAVWTSHHAQTGAGRGACLNPLQAGIRLLRDDDGGPLVEFAMVLPMMMVVMTGIFYLGIALTLYLQLTNATDIAARQLSISRGQTSDPCSTVSTAFAASAPNLSSSNLTYAYVINSINYSGTSCTGAAAEMIQGKSAQVTVQYPVHLGIYAVGWSTITLKAQTTELIQ